VTSPLTGSSASTIVAARPGNWRSSAATSVSVRSPADLGQIQALTLGRWPALAPRRDDAGTQARMSPRPLADPGRSAPSAWQTREMAQRPPAGMQPSHRRSVAGEPGKHELARPGGLAAPAGDRGRVGRPRDRLDPHSYRLRSAPAPCPGSRVAPHTRPGGILQAMSALVRAVHVNPSGAVCARSNPAGGAGQRPNSNGFPITAAPRRKSVTAAIRTRSRPWAPYAPQSLLPDEQGLLLNGVKRARPRAV
jgi:hypothetical protein